MSYPQVFFWGLYKYYKAFHHALHHAFASPGHTFQWSVLSSGARNHRVAFAHHRWGKDWFFPHGFAAKYSSLLYSSWCGFSTKERIMKSLAFYSCNHDNNWLCHGLWQHLVVSLQFASINQKGLSEFGPESTTGLSY